MAGRGLAVCGARFGRGGGHFVSAREEVVEGIDGAGLAKVCRYVR